jgi:hypothetical protein
VWCGQDGIHTSHTTREQAKICRQFIHTWLYDTGPKPKYANQQNRSIFAYCMKCDIYRYFVSK